MRGDDDDERRGVKKCTAGQTHRLVLLLLLFLPFIRMMLFWLKQTSKGMNVSLSLSLFSSHALHWIPACFSIPSSVSRSRGSPPLLLLLSGCTRVQPDSLPRRPALRSEPTAKHVMDRQFLVAPAAKLVKSNIKILTQKCSKSQDQLLTHTPAATDRPAGTSGEQ